MSYYGYRQKTIDVKKLREDYERKQKPEYRLLASDIKDFLRKRRITNPQDQILCTLGHSPQNPDFVRTIIVGGYCRAFVEEQYPANYEPHKGQHFFIVDHRIIGGHYHEAGPRQYLTLDELVETLTDLGHQRWIWEQKKLAKVLSKTDSYIQLKVEF